MENTGGKLITLGRIVMIAGILFSVIYGLLIICGVVSNSQPKEFFKGTGIYEMSVTYACAKGVVTAVLGSLISIVTGCFVSGFGELIVYQRQNKIYSERILKCILSTDLMAEEDKIKMTEEIKNDIYDKYGDGPLSTK